MGLDRMHTKARTKRTWSGLGVGLGLGLGLELRLGLGWTPHRAGEAEQEHHAVHARLLHPEHGARPPCATPQDKDVVADDLTHDHDDDVDDVGEGGPTPATIGIIRPMIKRPMRCPSGVRVDAGALVDVSLGLGVGVGLGGRVRARG